MSEKKTYKKYAGMKDMHLFVQWLKDAGGSTM